MTLETAVIRVALPSLSSSVILDEDQRYCPVTQPESDPPKGILYIAND